MVRVRRLYCNSAVAIRLMITQLCQDVHGVSRKLLCICLDARVSIDKRCFVIKCILLRIELLLLNYHEL